MPVQKAPLSPSRLRAASKKRVRSTSRMRRNAGNIFVGDMREYINKVADMEKRWWEYQQCASNRIKKDKTFYHPMGEDFHLNARDYNTGPDDCGHAYALWKEMLDKVNALAERLQSEEYKKIDPDKFFFSEEKAEELKQESEALTEMRETGSGSSATYNFLTFGVDVGQEEAGLEDDASLEGGEEEGEGEEGGSGLGMGTIIIVGVGVLMLAGGGYWIYRRRKAQAEEEA